MDTITLNEPLAQWVQRSRSGDREAFEKIVRQYQQIVSGISFGILGDFHKSEDIAQETFLIAWKKLDQLEDAAKLPAWLCQIARNLSKQSLLKMSKKATVSIFETPQTLAVAAQEDPVEQAIREERSRLIWDAVAKIPEKYRVPLILYYRSEKSTSGIAEALGISEDALSMRLTRAKKYLRKELEKQLEGAIAASGPGEFFSLAVVAALPAVAAVASPGKAVAASAMIAAPKSGPSGATLFGASLFGASFCGVIATLLLEIVFTSFGYLLFFLGAIPGIWYSVRNAPTLRTRRYLILSSLRANLIIALFCFICCGFFMTISLFVDLLEFSGVAIHSTTLANFFNVIVIGTFFILGAIAVLFALVSPWNYRRILREDLCLATPKESVPLEDSPLSFAGLEKTYKRFSTAGLIMLLWFFANILIGHVFVTMNFTGGKLGWDVVNYLEFNGWWYGFMCVGIALYVVFRQFHRRLLDTAKDETTFQSFGLVLDRTKTPFREKLFVEWLFYFGFFIAAGVIVALKPGFAHDWTPNYPIPLSFKLGLILVGSVAFAALNAVFPRWRWLITLGGCFLVICGISKIFRTLERGRDITFLDSPGDWPVLFGIVLFNIFVAFSIFAVLLLGALHYFAKWNGKSIRFSLPKKIIIAMCVIGATLLLTAPWYYSSLRGPYWYHRSMNLSENDAKRLEMCNEAMRLTDKTQSGYIFAQKHRAEIYRDMKQYENAIADFDAFLDHCRKKMPENWDQRENYPSTLADVFNERGSVKFLSGDLEGAVADFTESLNIAPENSSVYSNFHSYYLYNRGFAYEKLGETDKAIADYTKALELTENERFTPVLISRVPRPGYDGERHKPFHLKNQYAISWFELKDIRDQLLLTVSN